PAAPEPDRLWLTVCSRSCGVPRGGYPSVTVNCGVAPRDTQPPPHDWLKTIWCGPLSACSGTAKETVNVPSGCTAVLVSGSALSQETTTWLPGVHPQPVAVTNVPSGP